MRIFGIIAVGLASYKKTILVTFLYLLLAKLALLAIPFTMKEVVDYFSISRSHQAALTIPMSLIFGYALFYIGAAIFNELKEYLATKVAQDVIANVAIALFSKLISLSLNFHLNKQTGTIAKDFDRATKALQSTTSILIHTIIPTAIELVIVFGYFVFAYHYTFVIALLGTLILYIAFTISLTDRWTLARRELNEKDSAISEKLVDSISNVEVIKTFSNEAYETNEFHDRVRAYQFAAVKLQSHYSKLTAGQNTIIGLGLFFIMWKASLEIVEGAMSVGDFVLISALVMQICVPLAFIGSIYKELRQCQADIHKLEPILLGVSEQVSKTDKEEIYIKNPMTGPSVRFDSVTFGYQEQKTVLKKIAFEVAAGTTTAIVGASGSGKTTLLRLMLGFYKPDSGAIYIDDQNVKDWGLKSLRQLVSVIPQDPSLFNRSIAYNIGYGNITASVDRLKESASAAQLDECVASLPDGYDSIVGERGQKLSGGERQRVAIARALIRSPSIYVFDEATSALDSETEKQFQNALLRISSNKTTIVVAHRLATVMHAHQIIIIDGGEIVEKGSHDTLLERRGFYFNMWIAQQKSLSSS